MSIYAVNHLCREVLRDHAFRAAMKADPAKALAPLDLTDAERNALIAGDVGELYRLGANGFLMGYLARYEVCGLNIGIYNERMRAVKVDEVGQPVRCRRADPLLDHRTPVIPTRPASALDSTSNDDISMPPAEAFYAYDLSDRR